MNANNQKPKSQKDRLRDRHAELRERTNELKNQNRNNEEIYALLKHVKRISDIPEMPFEPVIFEIRTAYDIHEHSSNKYRIDSKSTAELVPFELLLDKSKTSDVLAEHFLKDAEKYVGSHKQLSENHIVPNRPSYDELEAALSRIFSKKNYMEFSELLETFNEPNSESLEHVIPHIVMVHPEKTDGCYVGEILADPEYRGRHQNDVALGGLRICTYRLLDER